jgi:hypothetical protein
MVVTGNNMLFVFWTLLIPFADAFQLKPRLYGEWILWHSTLYDIPETNRMVVRIYPNDNFLVSYRYRCGPLILNREKFGNYKCICDRSNKRNCKLKLELYNKNDKLISCFGLGLQFLQLKTNDVPIDQKYDLIMTCSGHDDIFLTTDSLKNNLSFHLIRSVRVIEPTVEVSLSSFIATQILGIIISQLIHLFWMH